MKRYGMRMPPVKEIELSVYIEADPERVFDALADYTQFFRGGSIKYCRVMPSPGSPPNGVGATREIQNGMVRFVEEITAFTRPERIDYLVTKCSVPLRHEGGQTTLVARGTGTEVRWKSRFFVPVPIVGGTLGDLFATLLVSELMRLLMQMKHELEA